jgi:hypothetical protein
LQSPQFLDEYITYKEHFNRYLFIVVDIKCLNFKKVDPAFQDVGWTIVPLFTFNGYSHSGLFQIPLVKGPVNKEWLQMMREKDPNDRENQKDKR